MTANFEPDSFAEAFPDRALAGFLANGEICGESTKPADDAEAGSGQEQTPGEKAAETDDGAEDASMVGAMSVGELKACLRKAGVSFTDCLEKSDLVSRVIESGALSKVGVEDDQASSDEADAEAQDFMHGFTAVFGISTATQSAASTY